MGKALYLIKHTLKWSIITILCLLLVRWIAISIVDTMEIRHSEYGQVKHLVRTRCPLMAEDVVAMIKNDGEISYGEYEIFYKACRNLNRLKRWRPLKKHSKPKRKGELSA